MLKPETEVTEEIRGLEETARFFEVSVPTVKSWIVDGCPVKQKGGNGVAYQVELRKVAKWLKDRQDHRDQSEADQAARDAQLKLELLGEDQLPEIGDGKLSNKGRAEAIKAELDKIKLAQLRRQLVSADEMRLELVDLFQEIRDRLRVLPDDLARDFDLSEDQAQAMLDSIDDFLNDLADKMETMGKEDESAAA